METIFLFCPACNGPLELGAVGVGHCVHHGCYVSTTTGEILGDDPTAEMARKIATTFVGGRHLVA